MNADVSLHRGSWGRLATLFTIPANASMIKTDAPDIDDDIQVWLPRITIWDGLDAKASQSVAGSATAKDLFWDELATSFANWGNRLYLRAHRDGLYSLEKLIHVPKSELDKSSMGARQAYNHMWDIKEGLKNNLSHFTVQKFTAAEVTKLETKLALFLAEIDKPQEAVDTKNVYQEQADALYDIIEHEKGDIVTTLRGAYNGKNDAFVDALNLAAEVGKPTGHRFTGIEGDVKLKDGTLLAGYTVRSTKYPNKLAEADLMAHYRIKGIRPGQDELELLDKSGTVVQKKVVTFKSGQMLTLDWVV